MSNSTINKKEEEKVVKNNERSFLRFLYGSDATSHGSKKASDGSESVVTASKEADENKPVAASRPQGKKDSASFLCGMEDLKLKNPAGSSEDSPSMKVIKESITKIMEDCNEKVSKLSSDNKQLWETVRFLEGQLNDLKEKHDDFSDSLIKASNEQSKRFELDLEKVENEASEALANHVGRDNAEHSLMKKRLYDLETFANEFAKTVSETKEKADLTADRQQDISEMVNALVKEMKSLQEAQQANEISASLIGVRLGKLEKDSKENEDIDDLDDADNYKVKWPDKDIPEELDNELGESDDMFVENLKRALIMDDESEETDDVVEESDDESEEANDEPEETEGVFVKLDDEPGCLDGGSDDESEESNDESEKSDDESEEPDEEDENMISLEQEENQYKVRLSVGMDIGKGDGTIEVTGSYYDDNDRFIRHLTEKELLDYLKSCKSSKSNEVQINDPAN